MYILPASVKKSPRCPTARSCNGTAARRCAGPAPALEAITATATAAFTITGYPVCAAGTTVAPTPYTTMVWQVPVAGGPLAIQPPDIQIVEAAVMGHDSP